MKLKQLLFVVFLFCLSGCEMLVKLPNDIEITPRDPATPSYYFFNKDRTLEAGDHIIDGVYTIRGNLTIKPGANVIFTKRGQFIVDAKGRINAKGTAAQPIVFKGKDVDHWMHFHITGNSKGNDFEFVEFNGGGTEFSLPNGTVNTIGAPFWIEGEVGFKNCTFKNSKNTALHFPRDPFPTHPKYLGTLTKWEGNTITGSGSYPLIIPGSKTINFSKTVISKYTGNKIDKIQLIEEPTTKGGANLSSSDVPYTPADPKGQLVILGDLQISKNTTLEASSIRVYEGDLFVTGEANAPARIKKTGNSNQNSIDITAGILNAQYLEIEDVSLNLTIGRRSELTTNKKHVLNNVTISNTKGTGLNVGESVSLTGGEVGISIGQVTIKNSPSYPLSIPQGYDFGTSTYWKFENNAKGIKLSGNLSDKKIFKNLGLYYDLTETGLYIQSQWGITDVFIEAGTEFRIEPSIGQSPYISFQGARINAVGTLDKPIKFIGVGNEPNVVDGCYFANSSGQMVNCIFEGFGKNSYGGGGYNVYVSYSTVSFQNCRFNRTTACGFKNLRSSNFDGGGNLMGLGGSLYCF